MQFVNDKFYIWYNRVSIFLGSLMILIASLSYLIADLKFLQLNWGFVPIIALIGTVQVVYGSLLFSKSSSTWMGGMICALILALGIIGLVHNSGQLHSWFVIVWLAQIFASGMYGLYAIFGSCFLVTLYYILTSTGVYGRELVDINAIGVVIGSYVIGLISYLIWKNLYKAEENQRINQLAGQLKNKQYQAEILIQSISDGMIVTDTTGKISLLNPAAAKMTGWTIEEAIGIDVTLVTKFAQEDGKELPDNLHPFKIALSTAKHAENIVQLLSKNGNKPHVVSIIISPIISPKSEELQGTVAVIRDVSLQRAEEARRADFISTASHEMRTPVAAVEGYLQLALNEKVAKIDIKARDYMVKALESTHRLGTLFQDLLTSAKAEDGRLVNHPVVVEMGDYLSKITDGLRFSAEKKGLITNFTTGDGSQDTTQASGKIIKPLYFAHIDPDRMQEAITNLFDNAVKYTESGKITIGLTGNKDVIQFFIRDTGHGIPASDVPHLFQKFYRVDNSSTRTIGGTGLGLYICRKIVELYNGRIWVESELGKGSTFYINLPRLTSQKASELQSKLTEPIQMIK